MALLGYLLPAPSVLFAWIQWKKNRKTLEDEPWRRTVTMAILIALSLNLALWVYAIVWDKWGHGYLDNDRSAIAARWVLFFLFLLSLFGESKVRRYLLLAAAGLWFFFVSSIGDVAI